MKRNALSQVLIMTLIGITFSSCDLASLTSFSNALDTANSLLSPSYVPTSSNVETSSQTYTASNYNTSNVPQAETPTSNGANLESMYRTWENRARSNYNSLTNLGAKVKKNGKDAGGTTGKSMLPSNYNSMKRSLREAQREMASIRTKAAAQGFTIVKSEYEDIQVSY